MKWYTQPVMNHLQHATHLKNTYFAMRHGQSQANVQEMIVSHPDSGLLDEFGLTDMGRDQAHQSATQSGLSHELIIYSSDFSRARQTAEIVRQLTGASDVIVSEALRERQFGDWERSHHGNYQIVWQHDARSADHTQDNVEPVNAVLSRSTQLICDLEQQYSGQTILLVSHGDTLQILQSGFQKVAPTTHRSLSHLETAEIRQLKLMLQ